MRFSVNTNTVGRSKLTMDLLCMCSREAALTGKSNMPDVICLNTEIKRLQTLIDDLLWNGEEEKAKPIQKELDYLLKLQAQGERFYCLF
jgi:hypothetical protein